MWKQPRSIGHKWVEHSTVKNRIWVDIDWGKYEMTKCWVPAKHPPVRNLDSGNFCSSSSSSPGTYPSRRASSPTGSPECPSLQQRPLQTRRAACSPARQSITHSSGKKRRRGDQNFIPDKTVIPGWNHHTEETSIADLVVVNDAGEELVLVGVSEGVVVPRVLHQLLDALEDELEVVLQLELVHALLALTGRHRVQINSLLMQNHPTNHPKFTR